MSVGVGILGSGNIGTDLMFKVMRSEHLEMRLLAGIDPESEGLARARSLGIRTSADGIQAILDDPDIAIVFDATSAKAHLQHAPLLREAGKLAIDLTPASVGPAIVPVANGELARDEDNISLATCAAQATVPIVNAISQVAPVTYAEVVATIASRSAGWGTRQNIDEFTVATAKAIEQVGGAAKGKAIIILNPAEPPILMTNTVYALVDPSAEDKTESITESLREVVERMQQFVPGYRIKVPPIVGDSPKDEGQMVTVIVEVEGAGDFLPRYAGNLDIITAAAVHTAEQVALQRGQST